jgi:hypothetical protein
MSMYEWEFLMQKEGDQDWLSLEAPTAEILEGRYRLMAQSQFSETPIDIQIRHICEQDGIPKRLMQRRSHTSNPEGLVGVIPYTYLQPGLWKFSCRANSGNYGQPDAAEPIELGSVQLLVHPHSAVLDSDWGLPEPPQSESQAESFIPEQIALEPIAFGGAEGTTLGSTSDLSIDISKDMSKDTSDLLESSSPSVSPVEITLADCYPAENPQDVELEILKIQEAVTPSVTSHDAITDLNADLSLGNIELQNLDNLEHPSLVINLDLDLGDTIFPLPVDSSSATSLLEANREADDSSISNSNALEDITVPDLQIPSVIHAEDALEDTIEPALNPISSAAFSGAFEAVTPEATDAPEAPVESLQFTQDTQAATSSADGTGDITSEISPAISPETAPETALEPVLSSTDLTDLTYLTTEEVPETLSEEVQAECAADVEFLLAEDNDSLDQPADKTADRPSTQSSTLLTLDCHAFTTSPGQMVTLTGQVLLPCDLSIQVRDPWNYQLVWQEHLSLHSQMGTLPWRFACEIIPPTTGTLVGEVKMLVVGSGQADSSSTEHTGQVDDLRQTQTFMITVLEAAAVNHPAHPAAPAQAISSATTPESPLSDDTAVGNGVDTEPQTSLEAQSKHLKVVRLPVFDRTIPPLMFQVSQGMSLPPQLHQNRMSVKKDLELPEFPKLSELPLAEQLLPAEDEDLAAEADLAADFEAEINSVNVAFNLDGSQGSEPNPNPPLPPNVTEPFDIPVAGRIIDPQIYAQPELPLEHTSDLLSVEALQFKRRFLGILRSLAQKKGGVSTYIPSAGEHSTATIIEDNQFDSLHPLESARLESTGALRSELDAGAGDNPQETELEAELDPQLVVAGMASPQGDSQNGQDSKSAYTDSSLSLPDFL